MMDKILKKRNLFSRSITMSEQPSNKTNLSMKEKTEEDKREDRMYSCMICLTSGLYPENMVESINRFLVNLRYVLTIDGYPSSPEQLNKGRKLEAISLLIQRDSNLLCGFRRSITSIEKMFWFLRRFIWIYMLDEYSHSEIFLVEFVKELGIMDEKKSLQYFNNIRLYDDDPPLRLSDILCLFLSGAANELLYKLMESKFPKLLKILGALYEDIYRSLRPVPTSIPVPTPPPVCPICENDAILYEMYSGKGKCICQNFSDTDE